MAYQIDRIKRAAREARRKHGTSPTAYLNEFARQNGFHTWDSLLAHQRALPQRPSTGPLPSAAPPQGSMHPLRKLLVLGVSELVARGAISLHGGEEPASHLHTVLADRKSVILWRGIGFDELEVSVWWDYNHGAHPQANLEGDYREQFRTSTPLAKRATYPRFVGAIVSGWLERSTGKYLMGAGGERLFERYIRRKDRAALLQLPVPEARGFGSEGKFLF